MKYGDGIIFTSQGESYLVGEKILSATIFFSLKQITPNETVSHLICHKALSLNQMSTKVSHEVKIYCRSSTTEAIKIRFCAKQQKIYLKKLLLHQILLDSQHCDASESRANFEINVENQKHP